MTSVTTVMLWLLESDSPGFKARLYHLLHDHGQVHDHPSASTSPVGKTRLTGVLPQEAAVRRTGECVLQSTGPGTMKSYCSSANVEKPPHTLSPLMAALSKYLLNTH